MMPRGLQKTREVWLAASTLALAHERITIRKLMGMTGIPSTSTVARHLKKLEDAGYITKPRGLKTTAADWVIAVPLIAGWTLIDGKKEALHREEERCFLHHWHGIAQAIQQDVDAITSYRKSKRGPA